MKHTAQIELQCRGGRGTEVGQIGVRRGRGLEGEATIVKNEHAV